MNYTGETDIVKDPFSGRDSTSLSISFDGKIFGQISDDGGKNGLHEHDVELEDGRFVLMQFIGLLDLNGREIYEGDLIEGWGGVYKIKFKNGRFVGISKDSHSYIVEPVETIKGGNIIGNVWENPELLENLHESSEM